jgi:hypothetical protein
MPNYITTTENTERSKVISTNQDNSGTYNKRPKTRKSVHNRSKQVEKHIADSSIEALIGGECYILASYLRGEKKEWQPRMGVTKG